MRDILITGHKGFIGAKLFGKLQGSTGIDLKDGEDLLKVGLRTFKLIYHLAAKTSVQKSWIDPLADSYNFNMTVRIAKRYADYKIIYVSSAAALNPSSPYGFSKYVSGEYLKKFHKNSVILYLSNVFGGGKGVVDIFKNNRTVHVYGDGNQVRDFVHVDDIVDALIKAKDWPAGEYYLGSGKGTKVIELTKGKKVRFKAPRNEIRESVVPNTAPNWSPRINVLDYLHA